MSGISVDRSKRDDKAHLIRCRHVACDVAVCQDEIMFTASPPLEALR